MRTPPATTLVSAMLFLLSLSASSVNALPFAELSQHNENLAARSPMVVPPPAMVRRRSGSKALPSPNANEIPFPSSSPTALASNTRSRSARSFTAPRKVPLPFLRPRSVESEMGSMDEELEDMSRCGEAGMHDCFVKHEEEREIEQGLRMPWSSKGSGKEKRDQSQREKRSASPSRRVPSKRASLTDVVAKKTGLENRMVSRRR